MEPPVGKAIAAFSNSTCCDSMSTQLEWSTVNGIKLRHPLRLGDTEWCHQQATAEGMDAAVAKKARPQEPLLQTKWTFANFKELNSRFTGGSWVFKMIMQMEMMILTQKVHLGMLLVVIATSLP
jgi:hypothetical protein